MFKAMPKKTRYLKRALMSTCALTMSLTAFQSTAIAQDAEQDTARTLDSVVVTARKREEGLQDTPISVTAATGEVLEQRGITNVAEIADFTPNLTFQEGASLGSSTSASIFVRGVGQSDFALVVDPGVGLYVDGVYFSRSVGGVLDLVDVERVEVLRGPQGTLFGKNTIGGAISIVSKRPADEFGGAVELTGGNFNRVDIKASVDIPLSETLRTKFSIARFTRDGFVARDGLPFVDTSNDVGTLFAANGLTDFSGIFGNEGSGGGFLAADGDLGDQNSLVGRFQADWDATSNLSFAFDFDYTRKRENSAARVLTGITPVDNVNLTPNPFGNPFGFQAFAGFQFLLPGETGPPQTAAERAAGLLGVDPATFIPTTANPLFVSDSDLRSSFQGITSPSVSDLDVWGVGLTSNWDLTENISLKSITAYRETENLFARDTDGTPFLINDSTNDFSSEQFTQELQLSGVAFGDRLNWILGGFYANEDGQDINNVTLFPITILTGGEIDVESFAAFAQGTFDVTDRLHLTTGVRWSRDDKTFAAAIDGVTQHVTNIVGIGPLPTPPAAGAVTLVAENEVSESFDDVSPTVNISYDVTDDILVYGSYSSGYKSGGFNQRLAPGFLTIPTFDEETIDVFEIGTKSSFLNNRVRLNLAAFQSNYDDVQLTGIQNVSPIIENAAEATIRGIEVEFEAIVLDNLKLDGSFAYLDAEYDAFADEIGLDASGNMTSAAERLAFSGVTVDDDLANAPEFSFNLGGELNFGVFGGDLDLRADVSYRSDIALDAANFLVEDDLTLLHLSATFTPPDSSWRITASGRNVTDQRYNVSGFADPNGIGILSAQPARPAEWSISVKKEF